MSKGNNSSSRSGSGNGSKFLPGGGKNGNQQNSQQVRNQTTRQLHTNPSHIGGRGGK